MTPNLNLLYVPRQDIGYGRLGIKLTDALVRSGIECRADLPNEPGPGTSQIVCWISTPAHALGWWKGQHTAMFTMWESSKLPPSFREAFHEFDTLIVPSRQNVDLFSEYHPNVHLATLGVDPKEWSFRERQPQDQEFRFMVGGSGPRKGTDLAYKAFMTLWGKDGSWGSGPTPKLVMKNPKGQDFYGPRVQMITGHVSPEEEQDLYGYAHCYLQPSRGEGFGLQPLQAIAQGCPTILTGAHGHESFQHLGIPISYTMRQSDYFIFGDAGDWWEPDLDDLIDKMRWVYENYPEATQFAKRAAVQVARHFTWDETARQFCEAFDPDLFTDYDGPWERYKPDAKLYRVRVLSTRRMEIAGTIYVMSPDEDYWVPADVKRILFEAGSLDPECLDDREHGLTEPQLERRGLYHAKKAFCPTCRQQLNTKLTLDEIYEALIP